MSVIQDSALPRVDRATLGDEIVSHLRDAICGGRLVPGDRLVERAIAESMGVSRGPVRDALRQLELEGLVTSELNRGTFVAKMTRRDIEEIYSLRMDLEVLAVRWLVKHATDTELKGMQDIVDKMAASSKLGLSAQEAADLDMSFHDAIYAGCRHRRVQSVWKSLRPQITTFLRTRNTRRGDYGEIIAPFHQQLLDVIVSRKEASAVKFIREHITSAYEALVYEGE